MSTVAPEFPETSPPSLVISFENLPFDCPLAEGTDTVILRSQDFYEFRVPKGPIIHISPILREEILALSGPQPASGAFVTSVESGVGRNAQRVVQLPVNSIIMFCLLSFISHAPPILPAAEQVMELLSVAQVYKMDPVLTRIRDHIAQQRPPFIRKETAFFVYALAQKYGLRTEALQAAQCTLSFSTMTIQDLAKEDKLGLIPGPFLCELLKYHQRARSCLVSGIKEFKTSQLSGIKKTLEGSCGSGIPSWLDKYISDQGKASVFVSLDFTDLQSVFVEHTSQGPHSKSAAEGCQSCSNISQENLHRFWEIFIAVVQGSIAKAESDFALSVEGTSNEVQAGSPMEASSLSKYSDMPNADVILRSSDLVNFRIHRLVLVTSSPVFRDMFSLPQTANDAAPDALTVVCLPETAEVLNSLISMLYPVPPEIPHSIDNILDLLAATEKFDMGAVQSSIRAEVSRKKLLSPTDSAGVYHTYAVACSKRLVPEMEAAAQLSLDHALTFESVGEALQLFDGWALRALIDFRLRWWHGLESRLEFFFDSQNGPSKIWAGCPSGCNLSHLPLWLSYSSCGPTEKMYPFVDSFPMFEDCRDAIIDALHEHIRKDDCHFCLKAYTLEGKNYFAEMERVIPNIRFGSRMFGESREPNSNGTGIMWL